MKLVLRDSGTIFGEGQGWRRSLHKSVRLAALLSFTVVLLRTRFSPNTLPGPPPSPLGMLEPLPLPQGLP